MLTGNVRDTRGAERVPVLPPICERICEPDTLLVPGPNGTTTRAVRNWSYLLQSTFPSASSHTMKTCVVRVVNEGYVILMRYVFMLHCYVHVKDYDHRIHPAAVTLCAVTLGIRVPETDRFRYSVPRVIRLPRNWNRSVPISGSGNSVSVSGNSVRFRVYPIGTKNLKKKN
jgi:non-ribosomal peptide synthetase component F